MIFYSFHFQPRKPNKPKNWSEQLAAIYGKLLDQTNHTSKHLADIHGQLHTVNSLVNRSMWQMVGIVVVAMGFMYQNITELNKAVHGNSTNMARMDSDIRELSNKVEMLTKRKWL